MTPDDLRAWHAQHKHTNETAAQQLGMSRSAYADLLAGVSRATGRPRSIPDYIDWACAAIDAGLKPWSQRDGGR